MMRRLWPVLTLLAFTIHPALTHAQWAANGIVISAGVGNQFEPHSTPDGAGGVFTTWTDYRGGDADIYAQYVTGLGAVQFVANGVAVRSATANQFSPKICSDGAGGAIIAWEDDKNGSSNIYAQRIDATGAAQWTAAGVSISGAQHDQGTLNIIPDGFGGAIIVWQDARAGSNAENDIYAQRVNVGGVVQWTTDGVAICTASNAQTFPTLVSDGAGGAIITWSDFRTGTNLDIYVQRISSAGSTLWTADGVALCTATNDQDAPAIATDGAGGAIAAWHDGRGGLTDIYAQRINAAGTVQWVGDGIAVCSAAGAQYDPQIVPDGSGGAFISWNDSRDYGTTAEDVYLQRINGSGASQWVADGVALCSTTGTQIYARLTRDGAGGVVVTWIDTRSGGLNYDIYAQRVDGSGAVQWAANGVALCTATNGQLAPTIESDGVGGAIVAWQDSRNATIDIYANRVTPGGSIPTPVGRTPAVSAISLSESYPNPFSAATSLNLTLQRESDVSVQVFDAAGRRVRASNLGRMPAGANRISFDVRDDRSHTLPSGVYFLRVHAAGETATRKITIQR